jgi:hypothetical protein
VRKDDYLTTFIVPKVEKIRSLNLPSPQGLLRPIVGKLYLFRKRVKTIVTSKVNSSGD